MSEIANQRAKNLQAALKDEKEVLTIKEHDRVKALRSLIALPSHPEITRFLMEELNKAL